MGRIRRLRDLPAGSVVFVDAGVLAPYFARTDALGQACAAFLEREEILESFKCFGNQTIKED